MSTKAVDSGIGSLQNTASSWDEGEFTGAISKYEVERVASLVSFETDEEVSSIAPRCQCLHSVAKPVFYEKLKVKVTTCEGQSLEKELVFSTFFKPDLLTQFLNEEIQKLPFDRFSKNTEQPSDYYSLKKDILEKLKSRTSICRIDDCYSVRQKYLSELFPKK